MPLARGGEMIYNVPSADTWADDLTEGPRHDKGVDVDHIIDTTDGERLPRIDIEMGARVKRKCPCHADGGDEMKHENTNARRQHITASDGDEFKDCNLSQAEPHTVISTAKNLHFTDCNLHNVEIDPSWTLVSCLAFHAPIDETPPTEEEQLDAKIDAVVSEMVELSNKYPDKVSARLTGKVNKETTEGLLSANGKPKKIDAPQGW